ncbi:FAD-binding oxidoreductase [Pseudorhodoferax sp. Leaf274]|uniref:FAD-binding oxidoreductase n=1 Tax=Pseudorhodoferax sp. Leaf274 TaxID=1736318 RepID=UPI0007032A0B|nr:FAD-binding oxidoreductase [Pseudorhodoferax sp. Leaf274]KQP46255.1 FAD-binding protein [Pseudorhodoferax sp. Leaf274]
MNALAQCELELASSVPCGGDLVPQLRAAVGADGVVTDAAQLAVLAHDVYRQGGRPQAAVRPRSVAALQQAVRACAAAGVAMVPRGGGASYTDGYLLQAGGHVLFDLGGLDSIEVDVPNAVVTVGAGVTWAALRTRLAEHGLRTPFWGPFSGLVASIGGSVSQNALSHGSASHGISAQSVLSVDVVLASGELLRTGISTATRHYGPDLTGLFTGDCGALGMKAAIRLPLVAARSQFEALSFAFPDFASFHACLRLAALEGLEDESFGLDRALSQGQIGKQEGLGSRLRIAAKVFGAAPSALAGVRQLLRMLAAGDRVLASGAYMAHFIVEGASAAEARAKAQRLRTLALARGQEIANSVPGFVRAMPFAPLTNILGPNGERWVPVHGILPHASVPAFHAALLALQAQRRAEMERLGVWLGTMFATVSSTGLLYEIALYWPEAPATYHEAVLGAEHLRQVSAHLPNAPASALAADLKQALVGLFAAHGAAHFQIGRAYPFAERLDPQALVLLRALKAQLDPHHLMNPGALGLQA